MGIRSIETAAEGLTQLTEEYSKLLNKFDKNINDRMQMLQIQMELTEKRQKRFDQPIDLMLQTGVIASAFLAGPLGLAISQAALQGYRIAKSDGNWKQKTVNSFIAAAKSEAAQLIPNFLTSKDGPNGVTNWRSYAPNFGILPDTDNVAYRNMSTKQQIAVYGGSYSAGTTVDSFLRIMPDGIKLEQVGSSKEKYSSGFSVPDEGGITLKILQYANRDMAVRIFQIQEILNSRERYKKITSYYGLAMATQNINIRSSHLGLKSREIIKMFYTGALSQATEDKFQIAYDKALTDNQNNKEAVLELLKQDGNAIHLAAKNARKNFLNQYKKQVAGSEIFARSTDYQRVYDTFALEDNVPNWARIDYKNQNNSLYYFYKHKEPNNNGESGFKELHQINSENFFKLLDTKILIRAYFDDYSDFFQKKIAGGLKAKLYNYMPSEPQAIQKHWRSTFNNQSRTKDIITIYLLLSIPQTLLGTPLVSQLIRDHKILDDGNGVLSDDEVTKDIQQIEVERIFAAIFNGLWAACSFHKQTSSDYTNNQIWNRVYPFVKEMMDILFTPFRSIKSIDPNIENDQLKELGLSNTYIVNNENNYNRKTALKDRLDQIEYKKLSPFLKATTPGVERRENVSKFERNSNMYEGHLFNFDDIDILNDADLANLNNERTLNAKYIYKKLIDKVKDYVTNQDAINSFTADYLINTLPKKKDKYSYTKTDNRNKDELIQYYSGKGVDAEKYSNEGYLKSAIGKVDSNKNIVADHDNIDISNELENLFLQQKFSIEALQMNKASQEEVLKNMHKTMVALAAKIFSYENVPVENVPVENVPVENVLVNNDVEI